MQNSDRKMTPIHLASSKGQVAAVGALIEAGADLNVGNYIGDTPLHEAVHYGHKDVVKLLLDKGADKDFPNSSAGNNNSLRLIAALPQLQPASLYENVF